MHVSFFFLSFIRLKAWILRFLCKIAEFHCILTMCWLGKAFWKNAMKQQVCPINPMNLRALDKKAINISCKYLLYCGKSPFTLVQTRSILVHENTPKGLLKICPYLVWYHGNRFLHRLTTSNAGENNLTWVRQNRHKRGDVFEFLLFLVTFCWMKCAVALSIICCFSGF